MDTKRACFSHHSVEHLPNFGDHGNEGAMVTCGDIAAVPCEIERGLRLAIFAVTICKFT